MAFVLRRLVPLVLLALLWAPAASAWSWPVDGPVLQQFSFDPAHPYAAGQHRGIDVGAPTGSFVLAPATGTVTFAGTVPTSGLCVTIETADGYSVTLTHLGTIAIARGASVAEGDAVGTVGPSGTPDFDVPYVHLGVRVESDQNGYLDPLTLLPPLAASSAPQAPAATAPAEAPAPPVTTTPASPAPVETPVSATPAASSGPPDTPSAVTVVSAPSSVPAAPAVPVSVAPATPAATTAPVPRAKPATPEAQPGSAPAHGHVRAQQPVATAGAAGLAHSGWRPELVAATPSAPLRHRPVPIPASPREQPAVDVRRFPAAPLALGAGATVLSVAALLGIVRLRRRPAAPPEMGAVVIALPLRLLDGLEERRVA